MSELVSNRKARYDYQILDTLEAGMELVGTEVKSLRQHGGSMQDAYATIDNDELWLYNLSIAPYLSGHISMQHEERRKRRLLVHKKEIKHLKKLTQEKGSTIIPLSIYTKGSYIKIQIAVAKGKKQYDKRQAIKKREETKSIERIMRRK